MSDDVPERKRSGFRRRTRLASALETLAGVVEPIERTDRLALAQADGRVLAEAVTAGRSVPHYERAAMDGYAVRATDTVGASDRSPAVLQAADRAGPNAAVRVHTGSELPDGADAVVMIEHAREVGDDVEVAGPVAVGENVAPVGEDVAVGEGLYEPGHRLRPSDLGMLKAVGVDEVVVRARPTAGVIPTGEELVQHDPEPGEIVETNGLTVSRLVRRWGGRDEYRPIVTDDHDALRAAIQRDLTKDVVVTTGGSSVGERDLLPEVIDELGEVLVHGVAIKPGHPVALGVVEDTPVLALPGYPVSCLVTATAFLRPTLSWLVGDGPPPHPTTAARLGRKLESEVGVRTFARVTLEDGGAGAGGSASEEGQDPGYKGVEDPGSEDDAPLPTATPTRTGGAGVLSSVTRADGWVVVPESSEGLPAGERVAVAHWEGCR